MLGKAHRWKHGPPTNTHRAIVGVLRSLSTNRKAQKQLRFEGRNQNWMHLIRMSGPLAERIDDLAPSLALDGPNPEYPWPRDAPQVAPAEHTFDVWRELEETGVGRQFLHLVGRPFTMADAFL